MSSWSERSFQLWPSLELRLLFSFFAPVVLPRLLPLPVSHVFVLRQIVLSPLTWSLGLVLLLMLWSLCQDHLADCFLLLESVSRWVHGHCELSMVFITCLVSVSTDPKPRSSFHSAFSMHGFEIVPLGVPIKCSSVFLSRPSQTPSSHADSNLLTTRLGFGKTCVESSRVVAESCRLWDGVYCHGACRGNHASRGLLTLMVVLEFFSVWIL